jgi:hypothetical protein
MTYRAEEGGSQLDCEPPIACPRGPGSTSKGPRISGNRVLHHELLGLSNSRRDALSIASDMVYGL